jgi:hypothetical protein
MQDQFFVVKTTGERLTGPLADQRFAQELANDLNRANRDNGDAARYCVAALYHHL